MRKLQVNSQSGGVDVDLLGRPDFGRRQFVSATAALGVAGYLGLYHRAAAADDPRVREPRAGGGATA